MVGAGLTPSVLGATINLEQPDMPDGKTNPYPLIFLDLDGTLVDRNDVVSQRTLDALNAAQQLGCVVVICTGRNPYMVKHIAAQWDGHGYGIFSNGAVVSEWETGHVLQKITLSSSTRTPCRYARSLAALLWCAGRRGWRPKCLHGSAASGTSYLRKTALASPSVLR